MREITQKIYNFSELDKNIQEKLIEKEIEIQKDFYCENFLYDDIKEKAKELLQKYFKGKAVFKNVYYSLNYCQGDGSMIEFELIYYNKLIFINHNNGHYYHENSYCIEYLDCDFLTDNQEKQLKEKIYKMNRELTKYSYQLIEFECERKEIEEILSENEYFKNGEIYKGVI